MPSNDGSLNPAERKHISDWLEAKCPNLQCSACGSRSWIGGNHLVDARSLLSPLSVWMFPMFCQQCSYAVFFNVHIMKVPLEFPASRGTWFTSATPGKKVIGG